MAGRSSLAARGTVSLRVRTDSRYACMAAVCYRVAASGRPPVRAIASECGCLVIGRHVCVGSMLGESVRRSTSKPLYCGLTVVGVGRTHYISVVLFGCGGSYGQRWERVAPQPSPRRLRNSGKEILLPPGHLNITNGSHRAHTNILELETSHL